MKNLSKLIEVIEGCDLRLGNTVPKHLRTAQGLNELAVELGGKALAVNQSAPFECDGTDIKFFIWYISMCAIRKDFQEAQQTVAEGATDSKPRKFLLYQPKGTVYELVGAVRIKTSTGEWVEGLSYQEVNKANPTTYVRPLEDFTADKWTFL